MESKLPRRLLVVPVALAALVLGACGGGGSSNQAGGTTSTSEAESPVGDAGENTEFCAQYIEQMQGIQASAQQLSAAGTAMSQNPTDPAAVQQGLDEMKQAAEPMATAFTELATDAPTEIQPEFEQAATAMNAFVSGDAAQITQASTDFTTAMANITTFMQQSCANVDPAGLGNLLGGTGGGTTVTTY